ncbi:MAG: zf-HC2 domain-containing protein [Candidatus Xenobiia bacterium LiM19]
MKSYNEDEEELRFLEETLSAGKGSLCPPSSLFAEYAVGNVSEKEREIMEKHLANCRRCYSVFKMISTEPQMAPEECRIEWSVVKEALEKTADNPDSFYSTTAERLEKAQESGNEDISSSKSNIVTLHDIRSREMKNGREDPNRLFSSKRRMFWPLAAAASLLMIFLITVILKMDNVPDGERSRGASPHLNIRVTVAGIMEPGSVQFSHGKGEAPFASLKVEGRQPSVEYALRQGSYQLRFLGATSESKWQSVEVTDSSVLCEVIVNAEPNSLVFTSSSPVDSLSGAALTFTREGNIITDNISSDNLVLGPFHKGEVIKDVEIRKGDKKWRHTGSIEISGGIQKINVDLLKQR